MTRFRLIALLCLGAAFAARTLAQPAALDNAAESSWRSTQFRAQLFAALEMVDKAYASFDELKSSWAGGLGVPQCTPTNVLTIAVDHDEDGRIDLWNVGRDDQTWGREVRLPSGGEDAPGALPNDSAAPDAAGRRYASLGPWRRLNEWQTLGVRRADGSDLPSRNLPAALILGDSGDDRGYVVYRNFCSIMRYNPAFRYALAVGLLADAIG